LRRNSEGGKKATGGKKKKKQWTRLWIDPLKGKTGFRGGFKASFQLLMFIVLRRIKRKKNKLAHHVDRP